jgi:uncharacterized protein (TIGR00255 family)
MEAMIRSMTGYGRREGSWSGMSLVVEVRSVNHRFCEVVARLPRLLGFLEDDLKRAVQKRCQRGRIELTVSLAGEQNGMRVPRMDRRLARQYHTLLRSLQKEFRLPGTIDLALLASFRDILTVTDRPADLRGGKKIIIRLLHGALSDLQAMRRREGVALARDIKRRVAALREAMDAIKARVPAVVQGYFERMKARVEQLVGAGQPDQARLHQELALYADRCDVSEELTRLASHLSQFEGAQHADDSVGRTLDFLIQEMGREINTIGSKANDSEITGWVVRMKAELEKIREQVQNIE